MFGIPIAILASNATEWVMHKYVLHGLGRKKGTFWSFHWHEHHKAARREAFRDADYDRSPFGWHAQGKEVLGLVGIAAAITPLLPAAPFFVVTSWACTYRYYYLHRRAHRDPAWAREHLPWHYDHHMGPDQDANWCVTRPWFDHLMGTRRPFLGTDAERARKGTGPRAAPDPVPAV